ncbi:unnamed protein product [Echinostoma caproni]|uniref:Sema domain-containing protein n=1 Tax=Echinostoma caproni TaxID=27848 RepID=A0A183A5D9_9TREM|nr:unnamed protein product [Echinostoma caproni]
MRTFYAVGTSGCVDFVFGGHFRYIVLLLMWTAVWNCFVPIVTVKSHKESGYDYCMLWHEEQKVILASGHRMFLMHLSSNQSSLLPILEWPSDPLPPVLSSIIELKRCKAAIKWVVPLFDCAYEVCGSVGHDIHCHVYTVTNTNTWKWISTQKIAFQSNIQSLLHHYVDGYSLLAYSPMDSSTSIVQLRGVLTGIPSTDNDRTDQALENRDWWNKVLETSNHNHMQLTISHKLRFHYVISAPGRRYLIFQEPGLESHYQQSLWTQKYEDVIYTRIARVCTGDPGMRSPKDGRLLFTSFFKARLVCRIRSNDSAHSLRFNNAKYQSSEIHFNYPISFTQSFINGVHTDPVIYGLFSAVDPELLDEMPEELTRGLYNFAPLALCAYRLTEIDNLMRSSDLIQFIPSLGRTSNPDRFTENMVYNVSGIPISTSSVPIERKVTRIRRIHSDHLETITDCPGPSINNRRLALEAPLLANPILPQNSQALGLIHPRFPITTMMADPRSFQIENAIHSTGTHPSRSNIQILYIGTQSGEVFKLLLINPDVKHVTQTTPNQYQQTPQPRDIDNSVLASGQIHVIQRLIKLPHSQPIRTLQFVQYDSSGGIRHVSSPPIIDGVAMGSPIGPVLVDIFMAKLETTSLSTAIRSFEQYHCYVDDMFFVSNENTNLPEV